MPIDLGARIGGLHMKKIQKLEAHHKRTIRPREVGNPAAITQLENHLPTVMSEIQIDYLAITVLCHKILQNLCNTIIEKFAYPSTTMSNGTALSFMVATILDQTLEVERKMRGPFDGGPLLKCAKDVFEATVEGHLEDEE